MTVQTHTLSNGFRIVSERMPSMKSASIGIWIEAGGRHERSDQNGIAHFLEHMAFKGTKTRSALRIAEEIEDVGGYINAYTSREMTAYYARVLEDDAGLALDLLADILLAPLFDAREIELERGVILSEIGQALDTPDDIVFDWLQEAAFPDQPMGRSILGPAEKVKQFDRADLKRFVAEHYGPGQMILAAAGAVDHDQLVRAAERLFGHLPCSAARPDADPARFTGGEWRQMKPLEQVHLALAFEGPDYRDPQIYTEQILASALGGGMSSRLFQELRERRGLCYSTFAQAGAWWDSGMLTIYAGTSAGQVAELADVTMAEIARAADDLSDAEIARARAQMKAGMLMGLESPSNRAERLARMVSIWGRVPSLDETITRIDAVTRDAVRQMAGSLRERGLALAVYGPGEALPPLSDLRARLAA